MFKALVRTRMLALGNMWFASARRNAKKRGLGFKIGIGLLAVYLVGCFIFMFGGLFSSMTGLRDVGLGWLYFAFVFLVSFALCFIGSVFTAQKQLFDANDNNMLLAMPIPPRYILGSRMLMLLMLSYVFEILVAGPAGAVWIMANGASARGVIVYVLCCLLLPFLVLTFSCLFGALIQIVMSRVRNKSLVTTVLSLAFLAAYFYVFTNMNNYISSIVANSAGIAESLRGWAYPACSFGYAVADGSVSGLLGFIACAVVPFAIVYALLSRTFIRVTTANRGSAKIKYQEKAAKQASAGRALTVKEMRRVASNGMLIMNTAIGGIFTIALAVMLCISRDKLMSAAAMVPALSDSLGILIAAALCFCASSNTMSASSISLEGRNVWIVKSMPVPSAEILEAKVRAHDLITIPPVLIAAIVAYLALPVKAADMAFMVITPMVVSDFCARLGVIVNLHFPRLDYTNEVAVVKQGASILITMLVSWAAVILPVVAGVLLAGRVSVATVAAGYTLLLAIADVLMRRYIRQGGARLFDEL